MSNPEAELRRYYSRRAPGYDAIYRIPERRLRTVVGSGAAALPGETRPGPAAHGRA